ncbi:unnamed protein product [Caenorhabditis angaria]|uniref:Uncharacterized protein n=1 Tax=Caenorhabditis angaria TaxID=860376 RepID=A0A9P1N1H5_9PELO|nr:unnamed protein product [Caenorhabditis angaria]
MYKEEDLLMEEGDEIDAKLRIVNDLLRSEPPYSLTKNDVNSVKKLINELASRLKIAEQTCIKNTDLLGIADDGLDVDVEELKCDVAFENTPNSLASYDSDIIIIEEAEMLRNIKIEDSISSRSDDGLRINEGEIANEKVEEEEEEKEDVPKSTNHVSYNKFRSKEKTYLRLKSAAAFDKKVHNEELKYPLGVVYDEIRKIWIVCEQDDKLIQIDEKEKDSAVLENHLIKNPSALTILREGHSIAILCADEFKKNWIAEYNYGNRNGKVTLIVHHNNSKHDLKYRCRGLARSYAGNIMTLDNPPSPNCPRLRLISRNGKESASFDIKDARNPSFIASHKKRVAVSDLGTQRVFIFEVNDIKWKHGSEGLNWQLINTIGDERLGVPRLPVRIYDSAEFNFVAGIQYDKDGFLIVADAGGHTMKLFDKDAKFLHRISSDFPIPFMSSFHINRHGRTIIIDLRGSQEKLCFAQLSSSRILDKWVDAHTKPKPRESSRFSRSLSRR